MAQMRGNEWLHSQSAGAEGGREGAAQEGSLLDVDPRDRPLVQDLHGRVLGIILPWHSHVCLHHPGRANSPYSLTESDSSYTVSCGTPVLRQGGQHRPTNSSQQCLGKGAPGGAHSCHQPGWAVPGC